MKRQFKRWNEYYVLSDMPDSHTEFIEKPEMFHSLSGGKLTTYGRQFHYHFGEVKVIHPDESIESIPIARIHWFLSERVECKVLLFGDIHCELHDRTRLSNEKGVAYARTLLLEFITMEVLEELFQEVFEMGVQKGKSIRSDQIRTLLFSNDFDQGHQAEELEEDYCIARKAQEL